MTCQVPIWWPYPSLYQWAGHIARHISVPTQKPLRILLMRPRETLIQFIRCSMPPKHPLPYCHLGQTTSTPSAIVLGSENTPPLAFHDVYIDDFITIAQPPRHTPAFNTLLHVIMRNKPLSLAGQAFVRFMIQFLIGCFKTFTYFCGKDNLDNRLSL